MKPVKHSKLSKATKGERLNWTPLRNVKPVYLSKELTKGQPLAHNTPRQATNFFVP